MMAQSNLPGMEFEQRQTPHHYAEKQKLPMRLTKLVKVEGVVYGYIGKLLNSYDLRDNARDGITDYVWKGQGFWESNNKDAVIGAIDDAKKPLTEAYREIRQAKRLKRPSEGKIIIDAPGVNGTLHLRVHRHMGITTYLAKYTPGQEKQKTREIESPAVTLDNFIAAA
jgi:hypothetical protein